MKEVLQSFVLKATSLGHCSVHFGSPEKEGDRSWDRTPQIRQLGEPKGGSMTADGDIEYLSFPND